jgi:hypothetical protein
MHRLPEVVALQIFELYRNLPFECHMPQEQLPREQTDDGRYARAQAAIKILFVLSKAILIRNACAISAMTGACQISWSSVARFVTNAQCNARMFSIFFSCSI